MLSPSHNRPCSIKPFLASNDGAETCVFRIPINRTTNPVLVVEKRFGPEVTQTVVLAGKEMGDDDREDAAEAADA